MTDEAPKTAYEVAMERLRRKDAEAGVVQAPLSDAQKSEIAELRRVAEARLAELEILHRAKTAGVFDPGVLEPIEQDYRREVLRATEDRERKIARVREHSS
jgi:hypothetical protein